MGSRSPSRDLSVLMAAALLCLATVAGALSRCPGDCDGNDVVSVDELIAGVRVSLASTPGRSCAAADGDGDGTVTVSELVRAVSAALDGCPFERVPFTATADDGALLLTPATALRGDAVYAVVLTDAVHDTAGAPLRAAPDFAAARGVAAADGSGPLALYSDDPEADANPYPDGRLVVGDGVAIPDRIAVRGLADTAPLAQARAVLRAAADAIGAAGAFSTTAPIRVALSAPVDLASVDADSALLIRRPDGDLALEPLLAALEREGTPRAQVALAVSFPTQRIEDDLLAARLRVDERGATVRATFVDPDPDDDLPIGVFAGSTGAYAEFLAANPAVAAVAHGLYDSPDFRGADGLFDRAVLRGTASPRLTTLDFILTIPRGPGPHPIVDRPARLRRRQQLRALDRGSARGARPGGDRDRRGVARTPRQPARSAARVGAADARHLPPDGRGPDGPGADRARRYRRHRRRRRGLRRRSRQLPGRVPRRHPRQRLHRRRALGERRGAQRCRRARGVPRRQSRHAADLPGGAGEEAGLQTTNPDFEIFIQRMLTLGQQALDAADPLNFASRWRADPLARLAARRVLIQEGIGDLLVSNESTEALAEAGGLIAQVPQRDVDGVSGLWRFDPPGGHGIFGRDDVRGQAVEFLASGGTEIVAP